MEEYASKLYSRTKLYSRKTPMLLKQANGNTWSPEGMRPESMLMLRKT